MNDMNKQATMRKVIDKADRRIKASKGAKLGENPEIDCIWLTHSMAKRCLDACKSARGSAESIREDHARIIRDMNSGWLPTTSWSSAARDYERAAAKAEVLYEEVIGLAQVLHLL